MQYAELLELCKSDVKMADKIQEAWKATHIYSTAVIYNGSESHKKRKIGSGTFVTLAGKRGILTNHHVAKIFITHNCKTMEIQNDDKSCWILPISIILYLPSSEDPKDASNYVDLCFILLDEITCYKVIRDTGKQFFNLDQVRQEYKINNHFYSNNNSLWFIYGHVIEEEDRINDGKTIHLKNSGMYFMVPDLETIQQKNCCHENISVKFDNISCSINVLERASLPKQFEGMSGGALWNVIFDENGKIVKITIIGIQTSQLVASNSEQLICRGPLSLYESFYEERKFVYTP